MKKYITLEDLKDFEVWKSWRNGGLELEPLYSEKKVSELLLLQRINPQQLLDSSWKVK
jgi:hypothetical protein